MAIPERDTVYTTDENRTVYTRESRGTGWFVGIIVALALLAIGYLVFSANSGTPTAVDGSGTSAVTAPADPAIAPAPMTEAAPAADAAPVVETAPAVEAAPATATPVAPAAPSGQ